MEYSRYWYSALYLRFLMQLPREIAVLLVLAGGMFRARCAGHGDGRRLVRKVHI